MEIMESIHQVSHKFGSSEAEIRGDLVIKRLDLLNRPLNKIILIDDDPLSVENYPKNTLLIKPYRNIYDTNDNALLELIPFLQVLLVYIILYTVCYIICVYVLCICTCVYIPVFIVYVILDVYTHVHVVLCMLSYFLPPVYF